MEAIVWMSIRRRDTRSATIAGKFTDKEANCRLDNGTVIRARGWPRTTSQRPLLFAMHANFFFSRREDGLDVVRYKLRKPKVHARVVCPHPR